MSLSEASGLLLSELPSGGAFPSPTFSTSGDPVLTFTRVVPIWSPLPLFRQSAFTFRVRLFFSQWIPPSCIGFVRTHCFRPISPAFCFLRVWVVMVTEEILDPVPEFPLQGDGELILTFDSLLPSCRSTSETLSNLLFFSRVFSPVGFSETLFCPFESLSLCVSLPTFLDPPPLLFLALRHAHCPT